MSSGSESTIPEPERRQAARAHLSAWLGLLPLFGLFTAFGIYSRTQRSAPWVARQALLSVIFQTLMFNASVLLTGITVAIGFAVWNGRQDGDDLVIAAILTGLPFYLATYLLQGVLASGAARAVLRGEEFRYPLIGRLVGSAQPGEATEGES